MEEMQRLIGRRAVESRPRPLTIATEPIVTMKTPEHASYRDGGRAEDVARTMDELAAHVDNDLAQVAHSMEQVHGEIEGKWGYGCWKGWVIVWVARWV